ncbi:hypothetical protein ABZ797_05215 [Streptomyces antimycoticus]|uniref:hypothetical protein n=1 Tax=Streptomyces antimycoticus TaxID=68175 RepID=UPI0033D26D06
MGRTACARGQPSAITCACSGTRGVTRTRQEGARCFVTLRSDDLNARFPGLLNAVLDAAHRDGVGSHVGLAGDPPTA